MSSPVVYDINVLVLAAISGRSQFVSWPVLPPSTTNPAADCIGVVNDCREFALWLSPHILDNTRRVLGAAGISDGLVSQYTAALVEIAAASGGDVISPDRTVHDCPDHEDNLILDLAAEVGALIIVSDDTDLTAMSPWRATPILRPAQFAARVDAMRRARRR